MAIGAATVPPNPPCERSIVTAIATFGFWTGAKPMNHGWVRFEPTTPICAVPVLPATSIRPSCAGVPVPSSTTRFIIWVISCAVEGFITWL